MNKQKQKWNKNVTSWFSFIFVLESACFRCCYNITDIIPLVAHKLRWIAINNHEKFATRPRMLKNTEQIRKRYHRTPCIYSEMLFLHKGAYLN